MFRQVFFPLILKTSLLIILAFLSASHYSKDPPGPDHHSKLPEMSKKNRMITNHLTVAGRRHTKLNNRMGGLLGNKSKRQY